MITNAMTRCARTLTLGLAVFALSASLVQAHGFRNPPAGAMALSLNGGKSVLVDDASGQAVNPALLDEVNRPSALVSITLIRPETEYTPTGGNRISTRENLKTLPNLFAAWPLPHDVTLGLGITTPFGQSVEWPRESGLPYFSELRLVAISPAVAYRVADCLSVGVALDVYVSDFTSRQPLGMAAMKGDGEAIGANAGLVFRPTAAQRLSLVYRTPFQIEYKGDLDLAPAPGLPARTDFSTEFEFPDTLTIGYALDVTKTLTLAAEVEWIGFSRFEELPVDAGILNGTGVFPPAIPQDWKDVWTYGAAARWACTDQLDLYLSYRYLESPVPDATLAATLPDADKHDLGIGFGWTAKRLRISAGYTCSILDDRTVSPADNPVYPGHYDLTSHIVSASVGLTL